jgi:Flp pilus assembly protein CpaB
MASFVTSNRSRRLLVLAVAAAAAALMLVVPFNEHADAAGNQVHTTAQHQPGHDTTSTVAIRTAAQLQFHDAMRKLWEDHVTWTRLAIVSFVDDNPDLSATVDRLMANQDDIGDAIKPYYGDAAGD